MKSPSSAIGILTLLLVSGAAGSEAVRRGAALVSVLITPLVASLAAQEDQGVVEIRKPEISLDRRHAIERVFSLKPEGLDPEQLHDAINTLDEMLKKSTHDYDRYIVAFHLTFFHAQAREYDKCLNLLENGQQRGFFFPANIGRFTWPEYLPELKKLPRFDAWFQENKRRQGQAQQRAKAEYFVQTPAGFARKKAYPLLIVLHGGVDSHINSYVHWQSPRIQSDMLVAYIQDGQVQGSFHRGYSSQWQSALKQAYQQIIKEYPVDTKRVLVGGASSGGMNSMTIAQDQIIPAAGAILAFPVRPPGFDENKLKQAAQRGVRVALLTGEKDGLIGQQREMAMSFERVGLPSRLVVFAGIGHEYPKDFATQIDLALKYTWNE